MQTQDKYNIRLPDGMRQAIKTVAKKNRRTMNAEIIYCIEQYLDDEKEKGVTEAATSSRHVQESQAKDKKNELND